MDEAEGWTYGLLVGDVDDEEADGAVEHAASRGEAEEGEGALDGQREGVADEGGIDLELKQASEDGAREDWGMGVGTASGRG